MSHTTEQRDQLTPVKRALLEIRELKTKLYEAERARHEPIAIIGMGCRFPGGANDAESLWRLLRDGVDAIREVPPDRWDIEEFFDKNPDAPGKMSTRWAGFLDEVDKFDADFFGISPREALAMDPQQRLVMEVGWEALENAGQVSSKLMGSPTGVYVGMSSSDYSFLQIQFGDPNQIDAYLATGLAHAVASGRLSYFLGLQGPSLAVDTACSSSLVAIHLACQSLRLGESRMAMAGGVNVILVPEFLINFSKSHMMAADGRCKTFDAAADGFVRAEGCGMVVLKRLSDALADGDNILAVIRGTAINQDGRSSGLTVPNGPSQQAVIRQALANAAVNPADVGYVETHGTGTSLGDPIEVQALGAVYREGRAGDRRLAIGSIKTNVGHLEAAAGVGGLLKVILAMQRGEIPPHLHLKQLSPHIPWENLPVVVPTKLTPWPSGYERRIAGVSSLGFSGTNAHVIVEAFDRESVKGRGGEGERGRRGERNGDGLFSHPLTHSPSRPLHVLNLSAKTERALHELAGRYENYFVDHQTAPLADLCYTANIGRGHFDHRLSVVAASADQMRQKLAAFCKREEALGLMSGWSDGTNRPEVVFLFSGQGAQYVGMGRRLFETEPTFRKILERCDELLRPHLEQPLLSVLYPEITDSASRITENFLDQTAYTQPAMFAIQYAIAELWRSWGIEPGLIMGHSVGEIVAATVAGMMSLEDGLMIMRERGRLMHSLPHNGLMASVMADEQRVLKAIAPYTSSVAIAALNGPESTVISGERNAVQEILKKLESDGVKVKPLKVSNSFHSPLVDPVLNKFEKSCAAAKYAAPKTALFSSMRLEMVTGENLLDAAYWRHNLRHTVRFGEAMQSLYQQGYRVFVEIGPTPVLLSMAQKCFPPNTGVWLPSLRQGRDDWEQLLETLSTLCVNGVNADWQGFDRHHSRQKIALPTYPFARQQFWSDAAKTRQRGHHAATPSQWEAVVTSAQEQSHQVPMDLALHTYAAKWRVLDRLTTAYIVENFRKLGAFTNAHETHSAKSILEKFKILPAYNILITRWLKKLAAEGLLQEQGENYKCGEPLPAPALATLRNEAAQELADIPFVWEYVTHCGEMAADVLTGKASALDTLFPGGSATTAENIYQHWSYSRYYNGISRAAIAAMAQTLSAGRQLRCIEIGAGTGGTTASLLPALPARQTLYFYTDVSEFFFSRAEEKFRDYPFLRCGLLDIEKSPAEQGYGAHNFDVVVAANVLHATRNLGETIDRVLSLLAPGGLLLLYEVTTPPAWFDISVGLIEGWQLFNDGLREDSPLLPLPQWLELLRARGFQEVRAFPEAGSPAEILGAHVMLARAPLSADMQEAALSENLLAEWKNGAPTISTDKQNGKAAEDKAREFIRQLHEAPESERHDMLVEYARKYVMKVLRRDPSNPVERRQRLMDLGIDSLMAVELRNLLSTGLGLSKPLPATLVFDYPNVEAIAGYLGKILFTQNEAAVAVNARAPSNGDGKAVSASAIEQLSEEEVEKMLEKKLEMM
jgi:acyl transferase domain-containing protein/SAM-dependent methyltransferase